MASQLQNICSQRFTGFEIEILPDPGNSFVVFFFHSMLFTVPNSYSFTVWFRQWEVIWPKRDAETVRRDKRLRFMRQQCRWKREKWCLYLFWYQKHLNVFSTQHMLTDRKYDKLKTRNLRILSKNQIIIISLRAWRAVVALQTLLGNSSYFSPFLPQRRSRATSLCCGLDEVPDGWACWVQATPTPSPSPCAADGLSGLLMFKRWNRNPAMRWWLRRNHQRNGRS